MAITASGAVSTALTQKRRVMLRSSESSSIAPATGTSAMPHFGQLPGLGLRISGCIGQVYSAATGAAGAAGTNVIPHLGQLPGPVCWISGCMGQV